MQVDRPRRLRRPGPDWLVWRKRLGQRSTEFVGWSPRLDQDALRRKQEKTARAIDALPLTWSEKAERWKQQTGRSGTTLWRVLQRMKGQAAARSEGE